MPVTEKVRDPDAIATMEDALSGFHGDLQEVAVTVGMEWVTRGENDDPDSPVLKLHGDPALMVIRITPLRYRMQGAPDAIISIDKEAYGTLGEDAKLAAFDHELTHLLLSRDDQDHPQTDDAFRPKLKMRPHDWVLGGFTSVVKRHGMAAIECQMFRSIAKDHGQLLFDFPDDGTNPEVTLQFADGRPVVMPAGEVALA